MPGLPRIVRVGLDHPSRVVIAPLRDERLHVLFGHLRQFLSAPIEPATRWHTTREHKTRLLLLLLLLEIVLTASNGLTGDKSRLLLFRCRRDKYLAKKVGGS